MKQPKMDDRRARRGKRGKPGKTATIVRRTVKIAADVVVWLVVIVALFILAGSVFKNERQLSPWGTGAFTVLTGSMRPTLMPGTMIFVKSVPPEKLRVGDIVTMVEANEDTVVTHRIVEINVEEDYLVTRGDDNNADDPASSITRVVGRVMFWIPGLGNVPKQLKKPSVYGGLIAGFGAVALGVGVLGVIKASRRPPSRGAHDVDN